MGSPTRTYFRVGRVERPSGRSYAWHDGYSTRADGGAQPWVTRKEARSEAKRDGVHPVFSEVPDAQ